MSGQPEEIVSQIWDESKNRLKNFIARKVNNQADVEDVLQNVFCKIHQNMLELKDPDNYTRGFFKRPETRLLIFTASEK